MSPYDAKFQLSSYCCSRESAGKKKQVDDEKASTIRSKELKIDETKGLTHNLITVVSGVYIFGIEVQDA